MRSLHDRHDRQGSEDAVGGIHFHRQAREPFSSDPPRGAVQRTAPAKSVVSVAVNASSMNHDVCPLPARGIAASSNTSPPLSNRHVSSIADSPGLCSAAVVRMPPCLRRAGRYPGHTDSRDAVAQHSAKGGTLRDHPHRVAHLRAAAVGRDREFHQRLDRRQNSHRAVVLQDFQIVGHVHDRIGGNRLALLIGEVQDGPDRCSSHVEEHDLGGAAPAVGEMREVEAEPLRFRGPSE